MSIVENEWYVVAEPVGAMPDTDDVDGGPEDPGGVVVELVRDTRREEVGRVAFVREHSENPEEAFADALARVLGTAREAVDVLNEHRYKGAQ